MHKFQGDKRNISSASPIIFNFGTSFGPHLYGMLPDLITIAEGLTSAYLPLFRVIVGKRICEVIEHGSEELGLMGHGWTYSVHPLGAPAGLGKLDILERENLTKNAHDTGAYLQQQFHQEFDKHPLVIEVREAVWLATLEFMADKTEKQCFEAGWKVESKVSAACLE